MNGNFCPLAMALRRLRVDDASDTGGRRGQCPLPRFGHIAAAFARFAQHWLEGALVTPVGGGGPFQRFRVVADTPDAKRTSDGNGASPTGDERRQASEGSLLRSGRQPKRRPPRRQLSAPRRDGLSDGVRRGATTEQSSLRSRNIGPSSPVTTRQRAADQQPSR
jgi:hypothetical protein